jgi:hypothetical protein
LILIGPIGQLQSIIWESEHTGTEAKPVVDGVVLERLLSPHWQFSYSELYNEGDRKEIS